MRAILPAAGYATRLYPLTLDKPKALLDVGGRPMVEHIIERLLELDISEIIIVSNDKFYNEFLRWSVGFGCRIPVVILNDGTKNNEDRLGTIGDIYYAIKKCNIDDDVIIVNADNLFSFDLRGMTYFSNFKKKSAISLYNVKTIEEARKMGHARLDGRGKVIFFKEKNPEIDTTICSAGIYVFIKEDARLIEKYLGEGNSADRSGDLIDWLHTRTDVYGYIFNSKRDFWFDIGSLDALNEARLIFDKS